LYSCIKEEGYSLDSIDIIFCSDEFLIKINKEFLKHDYFTDVITFSNCIGFKIIGEIYISVDRVRDNSRIYKVKVDNELNRILIHAVLHLMKYDDSSDSMKLLMTEKENHYLNQF
jgi:probable rRNA maturation factor